VRLVRGRSRWGWFVRRDAGLGESGGVRGVGGVGKLRIKTQNAKSQSKYQNGSTGVGLVRGIERIGRGTICDTHVAGAGWSAGGVGVRGVGGVGDRNSLREGELGNRGLGIGAVQRPPPVVVKDQRGPVVLAALT